jgi:chemotaxis regulatin CheY-phosphate phosphatase CheZ
MVMRQVETEMVDSSGEVKRGQIRALVEAARGMTEGNFNRLVSIKAKDEIGQLAYYINRTLLNLQQLDPAVKRSSGQIPRASSQLSDVVRTTEAATLKVLDETEKIMEEQERATGELERVKQWLVAEHGGHAGLDSVIASLDTVGTLHRKALDRAMEIIAAMEFQDLTTQKIEKTLGLMAEVTRRLVGLLFLFRLQDSSPSDPAISRELDMIDRLNEPVGCLSSKQGLVDQLLAEHIRTKG